MTSNEQSVLRISKHLLLSSPPGQFDQILLDLKSILSGKSSERFSTLIDSNSDWIDKVRSEFESRSGKHVLLSSKRKVNDNSAIIDDKVMLDKKVNDETELYLENNMRKYLEAYYSSKGVDSNVQIKNTTASDSDDGSSTFIILIYAERIQLPKYHAGSWLSTYNISITPNLDIIMDGSVVLHAHTFENGNVQMKSTTTLGPITMASKPQSNSAHNIIEKIKSWEENHVMTPLHETYDKLSGGVLKKLRRIMPVTRTKFDWNVSNYRLHKDIGMDVGQLK